MSRAGSCTLLLGRSEVRSLLAFDELLAAMEEVFRQHGLRRTLGTGLLHGEGVGGEFHIKAGGLGGDTPRYALKANGGFFGNMEKFGMPNIQGAVLLFDATNGYPLALMDSVEITGQRTAATTALAVKYLARGDSRTATVIGAGRQGGLHLEALARVLPLNRAFLCDANSERAAQTASELNGRLGFPVVAERDIEAAVRSSDVIVTCTPSRTPVFRAGDAPAGSFVAGVGADSPGKSEIEPALFQRAKVVVDVLAQCAEAGDLHHAIDAGAITCDSVHAELGEIVAGLKPGRTSDEEIILYDATGTALQDAGAASLVYEKALLRGAGTRFNLFA